MNITIYKPIVHKPLHAMSGLLSHHTKHTVLLLRVSALTWVNTVVKFLPFIEPNLCQACVVMVYYFRSTARKGIRGGFAKHMTHMGASGNFQVTTTHPNLQQGSRASHHTMCSSHSFVDTANTYSDTTQWHKTRHINLAAQRSLQCLQTQNRLGSVRCFSRIKRFRVYYEFFTQHARKQLTQ